MNRWLIGLLVGTMTVSSGRCDDLDTLERRIVNSIKTTIRQAGNDFQQGQFDQSAEQIRKAMKQLSAAMNTASPELFDALVPSIDRVANAHALLELEGVSLPPFRRPRRPPAPASSTDKTAEPQPGSPPDSAMGISFTKQIAPILAARCGRCHIESAKGDFSMSSFATLMKGPPEGVVIFPGDVVASRLIETIETGDMPRGDGRVPANELAQLTAWILAGAKFDGADQDAPLRADGSSSAADPKPLEVSRATGQETVSFAADVAPLLVENCRGCHLDAMRVQGGLRMDTFAQLLRGGDSGTVISPGAAESSLLVQKLRGTSGQRMPAGGRPPLPDDAIQLVSKWIDEGAKLDGASPDQPLTVMSQLAWLKSATTEQKNERRHELAIEKHQLASGEDQPPTELSSEHVLVVGQNSSATLELVSELVEDQMRRVRTTVPGEDGADYFRGRATIHIFPRRYDYSEFTKMVEQRGIPSDWTSHWRFDGIDAYVALVAGEGDDEESIAARLVGPLTSLAVATRGHDIPRWFAEGVGVAVAYQQGGRRDRGTVRQREAETAEAIAATADAQAFLSGKLTPRQTDRIGAAVAVSLLDRTRRRSFDLLLRQLAQGASFDQAFAQAFQVTPAQYLDTWLGWVRGVR